MSANVNNAAAVLPPRLTGAASVDFFRIAATTASTAATIPDSWKGKWIRMIARGCDVQFGITPTGTTAPTLVVNQAAAIGTGHLACGGSILSNTERSFLIPNDAYQLVYLCSNNTAGNYFEGHISSQRAR